MTRDHWRVAVINDNDQVTSERWFYSQQQAVDAAMALAQPGSLGAKEGDGITVEKHVITVIAAYVKPMNQ